MNKLLYPTNAFFSIFFFSKRYSEIAYFTYEVMKYILIINCIQFKVQFTSVQSLSCVQLFATPRTAARQDSLSITNSRSPPKPMSIESVMPLIHLILFRPLLFLPSIFPSISVFQMSQLFTSGAQSIGVSVSTSVLPMNTQD